MSSTVDIDFVRGKLLFDYDLDAVVLKYVQSVVGVFSCNELLE